MTHAISTVFFGDFPPGAGLWVFLSIGAVSLFGIFLPVSTWLDTQRREREAYYKAESMRRLAESSGDVLELIRQQNRIEQTKKREGMKIGGLVNIGIGIALALFLYFISGGGPQAFIGGFPLLIGIALLAYVYLLAAPIE